MGDPGWTLSARDLFVSCTPADDNLPDDGSCAATVRNANQLQAVLSEVINGAPPDVLQSTSSYPFHMSLAGGVVALSDVSEMIDPLTMDSALPLQLDRVYIISGERSDELWPSTIVITVQTQDAFWGSY